MPMGSFRHTGVGDPTARNQYATASGVQDGTYTFVGSVTGTNTIAGSLAPVITAYTAGMQVVLVPANANTAAATLNLNGAGALDVQKYTSAGQVALAANDLRAGIPALLILDTGGDDWILLNPYSGALGDVTVGTLTATTISGVTNLSATNINGVTAPASANPTGTIGLTAVNGTATTFPRSDSAPALSQAIAPTWSAQHIYSAGASASAAGWPVNFTSTNPGFQIRQSNGSVDNKAWEVRAAGEQLLFGIWNDAYSANLNWLTVDRTGITCDSIALVSTALTWNGNAVLSSTSSLNASNLGSGLIPDGRVQLSNVSQHAGSISTRNVPGLVGTAVTIQSDPGGTPSGNPGEVFEYY